MIADYFTKPLQGELFYKFRDQIMGVVPMDTIHGNHRSVLDKDLSNRASLSNQRESTRKKGNHKDSGADRDARKLTGHKTWSDVVKLKPPVGAQQSRKPIIIR